MSGAKERLRELVESLPEEDAKLAERVLRWIAEGRIHASGGKVCLRLGGLLEGARVSEEEIEEARKEAWKRGRR